MAAVVREALLYNELPEPLVDQMILEWWKQTILPGMVPNPMGDLLGLMKEMLPTPDEDE